MRTILAIGLCLAFAAAEDSADKNRPTRDLQVCSAWDVHITTQIEDFGSMEMVSARDLVLAFFQQLKARDLCNTGKTKEAVLVYEEIDFPICPDFPCVGPEG